MTTGNFSDSSDFSLAFIPEATFKAIPATPAWKRIRITSESLTDNVENKESDEMRPDGGVSDLTQVGADVKGDFQGELSYGTNFRVLLAACLRGTEVSDVIKRGILKPKFAFEKTFDTGNKQYMRFRGNRFDSLDLEFKAKEKATWKMGVVGCVGDALAQTIITGATYVAENRAPIMAAPDVAAITIDGVTSTNTFNSISVNIKNNLRMQTGLGTIEAAGIGYGTTQITGSASMYFDSEVEYNKFKAGAASSLEIPIFDALGNGFTFGMPRFKYTSGKIVAGGKNQDVMVEFQFQATIDDTEGTDFIVTTTGAPV